MKNLYCVRIVALVAALACSYPGQPKPISADVIWIRGQTRPLFGQVISNSDNQIELQVFEDGKPGRVEKLERSKIEQMIVNIDTQRLERLDPSNPFEYREYAEELASQRSDPAARALAKRLYLIAAATASTSSDMALRQLCDSSLSALVAIADSEKESQGFKTMRFLMGSDTSANDIYTTPSRTETYSKQQSQSMLELILAIRQEDSATATRLLNSEANRNIYQLWSDLCSLEELDRIAKVNRPSKPQLSKLLRIELQIRATGNSATTSSQINDPIGRRSDWGDFCTQDTGILGDAPSFENVSNLDPQESIFRNGAWQRPEPKADSGVPNQDLRSFRT